MCGSNSDTVFALYQKSEFFSLEQSSDDENAASIQYDRHFTSLSLNTKYYVVATSLESQNFYQGPPTTTAYEFTTLSNTNETQNQPTAPAQEEAGSDNFPQTGIRSSIVRLLGAAALTLDSAIFTLRRYGI